MNKHPSSGLNRTDLIITLASKGTLHENTTWPENAENVQIFTCRLPIIVLHIFMKHKYFFLRFLSLEYNHFWLAHSLVRNRKRLACDVQDTSATHAGLIDNVTGTDCLSQNGSAQGHVFAILKH